MNLFAHSGPSWLLFGRCRLRCAYDMVLPLSLRLHCTHLPDDRKAAEPLTLRLNSKPLFYCILCLFMHRKRVPQSRSPEMLKSVVFTTRNRRFRNTFQKLENGFGCGSLSAGGCLWRCMAAPASFLIHNGRRGADPPPRSPPPHRCEYGQADSPLEGALSA